MYKNGNSLSIDTLLEVSTDEPNGVTIELNIKKIDLKDFITAIYRQLEFFDNVVLKTDLTTESYINYDSYIYTKFIEDLEDFNNYKIKSYKTFKCNSLKGGGSYYSVSPNKGLRILLGKVVYPLEERHFKLNFESYIFYHNVALSFDIGDLEVTPNREEIIYSQKSIEKINEKLKAYCEEINQLYKKEIDVDFQDFYEFLNKSGRDLELTIFEDGVKTVKINININNKTLKYKGKDYDIQVIRKVKHALFNYRLGVRFTLTDNFNLKSNNEKYFLEDYLKGRKFTKIVTTDPLSLLKPITKKYIKEVFQKDTKKVAFLPKLDEYYFNKIIDEIRENTLKGVESSLYNLSEEEVNSILVHVEDFLSNWFNSLEYYEDSIVPQSFILADKQEKKSKRELKKRNFNNPLEIVSVGVFSVSEKQTELNITRKVKNMSYEDISKIKCLVICSDVDDNDKLKVLKRLSLNHCYSYRKLPKLEVISVANTKLSKLKEFNNVKTLREMLENPNEHKLIKRIGTAVKIYYEFPDIHKLYNYGILKHFNTKLYEILSKIFEYCDIAGVVNKYYFNNDKIDDLKHEIYLLCKNHDAWDLEMLALWNNNKVDLLNSTFLLNFKGADINSFKPYIVDYILARKLFKLDVNVVNEKSKELFINKFNNNE